MSLGFSRLGFWDSGGCGGFHHLEQCQLSNGEGVTGTMFATGAFRA